MFWTSQIKDVHLASPIVFDLGLQDIMWYILWQIIIGWKTMAVVALLLWYIDHREKPTYLLDFACFEPPKEWKFTGEEILKMMKLKDCYSDQSMEFMTKIMQSSGVGRKWTLVDVLSQSVDEYVQRLLHGLLVSSVFWKAKPKMIPRRLLEKRVGWVGVLYVDACLLAYLPALLACVWHNAT